MDNLWETFNRMVMTDNKFKIVEVHTVEELSRHRIITSYGNLKLLEAITERDPADSSSSSDDDDHVHVDHVELYIYINKSALRLARLACGPQHEQEVNALFTLYADKFLPVYMALSRHDRRLRLDILQKLSFVVRAQPEWSPAHISVELQLGKGIYSTPHLQPFVNSKVPDTKLTPLLMALMNHSMDIAVELLQAGALISLAGSNNSNIIHYCTQHCTDEQLETLLVNASRCECEKACAALTKDTSESPLHYTAKLNDVERTKILLRNCARVGLAGVLGTPLHYAVKFNSLGVLALMLEKEPGSTELLCGLHGGTAMHWCKTIDVAMLLFKVNSPLGVKSSSTGDEPLHVVASRDRVDVALALIIRNVNINAIGRYGNTPLHVAAEKGHVTIVKALIIYGARLDIKNDAGYTAYENARNSRHKSALEILALLNPSTSLRRNTLGYTNQRLNREHVPKSLPSRTKLLALDGGGVKGFVICQILAVLESRTGKKTRELFDFISGTSTGAILALALSQGKPARECQKDYCAMKDEVFVGGRPYSADTLEAFLKKLYGEGETMETLRPHPRVLVLATLADRRPVIQRMFRNYEPPRWMEGYDGAGHTFDKDLTPEEATKLHTLPSIANVPLWKVARYSGAAPTFFTSLDKYLDGALLANNPTIDSLVEINSLHKLRMPRRQTHSFSSGACAAAAEAPHSSCAGGGRAAAAAEAPQPFSGGCGAVAEEPHSSCVGAAATEAPHSSCGGGGRAAAEAPQPFSSGGAAAAEAPHSSCGRCAAASAAEQHGEFDGDKRAESEVEPVGRIGLVLSIGTGKKVISAGG